MISRPPLVTTAEAGAGRGGNAVNGDVDRLPPGWAVSRNRRPARTMLDGVRYCSHGTATLVLVVKEISPGSKPGASWPDQVSAWPVLRLSTVTAPVTAAALVKATAAVVPSGESARLCRVSPARCACWWVRRCGIPAGVTVRPNTDRLVAPSA